MFYSIKKKKKKVIIEGRTVKIQKVSSGYINRKKLSSETEITEVGPNILKRKVYFVRKVDPIPY